MLLCEALSSGNSYVFFVHLSAFSWIPSIQDKEIDHRASAAVNKGGMGSCCSVCLFFIFFPSIQLTMITICEMS